jgi:hypothetical protein
MEDEMIMKETVVIYTGKMARMLLREGFELVDIRPDKTDPERKRSVFIFKQDMALLERLKRASAK